VLWLKGCFGADSTTGNEFVARIFTVAATCRQQQRDLLAYLTDAVVPVATGIPPRRSCLPPEWLRK
jgi:transposase